MEYNVDQLSSLLREKLESYDGSPKIYDYGTVVESFDGITIITGLPNRSNGELLEFEGGAFGMALELSLDKIGAVILQGNVNIGEEARGTGTVVEVPVGDCMLGRVVNPIGKPIDGMELIYKQKNPIEHPAPTIIERQAVNSPLETGILAIDSMIPIGKGQRELIIGDRQTGKTSIAIDAILNQKGKNVKCIYCAIGQKASTVAEIVETLKTNEAFDYTVIVSSVASDNAAMQYISPYSACAIGEHFMHNGNDVLIVYDDLSKHAVAYRTMSLLLHRPPGREAYPGDVFYLHSRLLERSAHLNDALGGGSMTALPIIETMAGDISAYIPTNVISITDGQIYLEAELFNSGMRPAVNVGLSVSRVGRSAQFKAMRAVSGTLRLDLAQYNELKIFTQFGSDIDSTTKSLLDKGERLTQTLKQGKSKPYNLSEMICMLLAFNGGVLKNVSPYKVKDFNDRLLEYLLQKCPVALSSIERTHDLDAGVKSALVEAINQFLDESSGM